MAICECGGEATTKLDDNFWCAVCLETDLKDWIEWNTTFWDYVAR